jgi:hypothetical protein
MSTLPLDHLEKRAIQERNELHQTASELRSKLEVTRENLRLSNQARQHFGPASWFVSLVGFYLGYAAAGMFFRR